MDQVPSNENRRDSFVMGDVNRTFQREDFPSITVSNSPSLASTLRASLKRAKSGPKWLISYCCPFAYKFRATLAENVPLRLAIMDEPDFQKRIDQFKDTRRLEFEDCLGAGTQGSVFVFKVPSQETRLAVKFHRRKAGYDRELNVYLRLRELSITDIGGYRVPILVGYDNALLSIEMTIVTPPFCLDFGGAYLYQPPDYSPEVWGDWEQMKSEAFEENWPKVKSLLAEFRWHGIYIADVNPGNIKFK